MQPVRVTYRLAATPSAARALARALAIEQTIEVPEALLDAALEARFVGRVHTITEAPGGGAEAVLDYPGELAGNHLAQLLNLLLGNASLLDGVRLVGLELPRALRAAYGGPRHGLAGLRARCGRGGPCPRPLLATALKPRGASTAELAALAGAFARAGGDLVKDDHNLIDADARAFEERVRACVQAVRDAERPDGRALYLPFLAAPFAELPERLALARAAGADGVLVAPFLMGLDPLRELLASQAPELLVMAHPALAGGFLGRDRGIAHEVLLGRLLRLFGADCVIYPGDGGRFGFTRAECLAISKALREPWEPLAPAAPAIAGGLQPATLPAQVRAHGADTVFLIGGALLTHARGVEAATRELRAALDSAIDG